MTDITDITENVTVNKWMTDKTMKLFNYAILLFIFGIFSHKQMLMIFNKLFIFIVLDSIYIRGY